MNLSDVAIVEVPVAQFFKLKIVWAFSQMFFLPFLTNFVSAHALTLLKTNEDVCMVWITFNPLTANVTKGKFRPDFQISFCKILKNK